MTTSGGCFTNCRFTKIELEMQNAKLQEARDEIAFLLDSHADLYDFAPMGSLSLDERGNILKANLTATTILGLDRSSLTGTPFEQLITDGSKVPFLGFINARFGGIGDMASCDLACRQPPSRVAWIRVEAFGPVRGQECGGASWASPSDGRRRRNAGALKSSFTMH
ncbi:MAG TPA: hypothetical protein VN436_16775, partial [Holophaga sp.]|nr:hypothetical protein [Holophaga sp.]